MEGSSEGRGEGGALDRRATWFAQRLGEGWTEVEPGIYRFDIGAKNDAFNPMASPSESAPQRDLLDALNPAGGGRNPAQPSAADVLEPQPTRRLFGRRART